jgi:hypothetical protein
MGEHMRQLFFTSILGTVMPFALVMLRVAKHLLTLKIWPKLIYLRLEMLRFAQHDTLGCGNSAFTKFCLVSKPVRRGGCLRGPSIKARIGFNFQAAFLGLLIALFSISPAKASISIRLPHDFHVAIITIDHNPQTKALEITCKVFTDDLENAMEAIGGIKLSLGEKNEHPKTDEMLFAYLQNRLQLSVNGQKAEFDWVGKEIELDATWMYIEIPNVADLNALEVTCRILTERFDDQSNLVHVSAKGTRKSLYLRKDLVQDHLSF